MFSVMESGANVCQEIIKRLASEAYDTLSLIHVRKFVYPSLTR